MTTNRKINRRKFIVKTGKASLAAAVTGTVGWLFHNRASTSFQKLMVFQNSFQVPVDVTLPKVTLARSENHITALNLALDGIGGIKRFIKPGEKVVIKPNVGWDRTPEQAANSNPILIGELTRLCFSAGASQVVVTDVTCNHAPRCFIRSGIRSEVEKAGGKIILPRDQDFVKTDLGGKILSVWPVLRHFMECDKLINVPIVKDHTLSTCTIGMKNLYGILGGRRNQLHQEIDQSIVDLAQYCTPTLTVVDATRILLRGGPTGGSLDDVAIENSVICATDQVAADARGVQFLGISADKIGHIKLAHQAGLGEIDYNLAGYHEISP